MSTVEQLPARPTSPPVDRSLPHRTDGAPHIEFQNVSAFYGSKQVLKDVTFTVARNTVFGIIGPANS